MMPGADRHRRRPGRAWSRCSWWCRSSLLVIAAITGAFLSGSAHLRRDRQPLRERRGGAEAHRRPHEGRAHRDAALGGRFAVPARRQAQDHVLRRPELHERGRPEVPEQGRPPDRLDESRRRRCSRSTSGCRPTTAARRTPTPNYTTTATSLRLVGQYVANTASDPIFRYFDADGAGARRRCPLVAARAGGQIKVRTIKIALVGPQADQRAVQPMRVESTVRLANVIYGNLTAS